VPAFSIEPGREFVHDQAASTAKAASYSQRYHQVSDEYDPSWDLTGMTQTAQYTLALGRLIADAPHMPQWNPDDAFAKARVAAK